MTTLLLFGYYILSFLTISHPFASTIVALGVGGVFAYVCYKNIHIGFMLLLGSCIVGSFGYEFAVYFGSIKISIRILLFTLFVVISLLSRSFWKKFKETYMSSTGLKLWILFFIILAISVVHGVVRGNTPALVFGDSNNYIFYALFPYLLIWKNELYATSTKILLTSWKGIVALSTFCLYIFSHNFSWFNGRLYTWIRDARIGEVTRVSLDSEFYRVFFQTHSIALVFVALAIYGLMYLSKSRKEWLRYVTILTLGWFTLLLSFSRSLWLGLVAVVVVIITTGMHSLLQTKQWRSVGLTALGGVVSFISGIVLLFGIVLFPYPSGGAFSLDAIKNRASSFSDDAASSRWNLRGPLEEAISQNYIFGLGFGTTVTYKSNDPRIQNETNPEGWTTTSSFEWGFHDMVSEYGILGLLVLILALLYTLKELRVGVVVVSVVFGLSVTHIFTPYLNHPLGITAILVAILLEQQLLFRSGEKIHSQNHLHS